MLIGVRIWKDGLQFLFSWPLCCCYVLFPGFYKTPPLSGIRFALNSPLSIKEIEIIRKMYFILTYIVVISGAFHSLCVSRFIPAVAFPLPEWLPSTFLRVQIYSRSILLAFVCLKKYFTLFFKAIFTGYKILIWQVFSFHRSKHGAPLSCDLHCFRWEIYCHLYLRSSTCFPPILGAFILSSNFGF